MANRINAFFTQKEAPSGPTKINSIIGLHQGQLIRFKYLLAKNDPQPLVIVTRLDMTKKLLKGTNLHYLTLPLIRMMLYQSTGPYYNKSNNSYINSAFRSYSFRGIDISSIELFDTQFIIKMINMARTMDPVAIRSMRMQIDQQINAKVNQDQALPTNPTILSPLAIPRNNLIG